MEETKKYFIVICVSIGAFALGYHSKNPVLYVTRDEFKKVMDDPQYHAIRTSYENGFADGKTEQYRLDRGLTSTSTIFFH